MGAGLCGLTTAYLLQKAGYEAIILEARDRIGGRILTSATAGATPLEMGATWLGKKHTNLLALLQELELDIYPQHLGGTAIYEPISTSPPQLVTLPPNDEPSYRIKGGTSALIDALRSSLNTSNIHLGVMVKNVHQRTDKRIDVITQQATFTADRVIVTLPPYLWQSTIAFEPTLPHELTHSAKHTHTWMGESIKVGLRYAEPFWRKADSSGTIFSNVGYPGDV
ncbi:MAG: FAD-dependent oxidoreductase [Bacteroidota bacterium]